MHAVVLVLGDQTQTQSIRRQRDQSDHHHQRTHRLTAKPRFAQHFEQHPQRERDLHHATAACRLDFQARAFAYGVQTDAIHRRIRQHIQ